MKTGRFTLAFILFLSGVLLLLENFGLIRHIFWSSIIRYWPVILIILGLEMLLERKFIWILFFLLLFLIGFISVIVLRMYFAVF